MNGGVISLVWPPQQPPETGFWHTEPMPMVSLWNSFDDLHAK